jgi:hypothetical protein
MTQDQAYNEFIPYINDVGKIYRKISPVFARLAKDGEYIETWTDDGLETTNYAKEGDFVVMNLYTSMKEEYIVCPDMMTARYEFVFDLSEGGIYKPTGKVKAAIYSENTEYWFYLSAPNSQTIYAKTLGQHLINKAKCL